MFVFYIVLSLIFSITISNPRIPNRIFYFSSINGKDLGTCENITNPCKTFQYIQSICSDFDTIHILTYNTTYLEMNEIWKIEKSLRIESSMSNEVNLKGLVIGVLKNGLEIELENLYYEGIDSYIFFSYEDEEDDDKNLYRCSSVMINNVRIEKSKYPSGIGNYIFIVNSDKVDVDECTFSEISGDYSIFFLKTEDVKIKNSVFEDVSVVLSTYFDDSINQLDVLMDNNKYVDVYSMYFVHFEPKEEIVLPVHVEILNCLYIVDNIEPSGSELSIKFGKLCTGEKNVIINDTTFSNNPKGLQGSPFKFDISFIDKFELIRVELQNIQFQFSKIKKLCLKNCVHKGSGVSKENLIIWEISDSYEVKIQDTMFKNTLIYMYLHATNSIEIYQTIFVDSDISEMELTSGDMKEGEVDIQNLSLTNVGSGFLHFFKLNKVTLSNLKIINGNSVNFAYDECNLVSSV